MFAHKLKVNLGSIQSGRNIDISRLTSSNHQMDFFIHYFHLSFLSFSSINRSFS